MKLSKVDDEFGEDGFDIWEIEEEMWKIEKEEEEIGEYKSPTRFLILYIRGFSMKKLSPSHLYKLFN